MLTLFATGDAKNTMVIIMFLKVCFNKTCVIMFLKVCFDKNCVVSKNDKKALKVQRASSSVTAKVKALMFFYKVIVI